MAAEGIIPPSGKGAWRSAFGDPIPTPIREEQVLLTSYTLRGMALPLSAFFLELLSYYSLQPHNITPNSLLYIAGFVGLFEGNLGVKSEKISPNIGQW